MCARVRVCVCVRVWVCESVSVCVRGHICGHYINSYYHMKSHNGQINNVAF